MPDFAHQVLGAVQMKLAVAELKKRNARAVKFDPRGIGTNGPVIVRRQPFSPFTPGPAVPGFPGPGFPGPGGPGPGFPGPGGPRGGQLQRRDFGGLATTGCQFLPIGRARDACLAATGFLFQENGAGPAPCPAGTFRVGADCVAPGDVFPGGDPFITGAGGVPSVGAFGLPALSPTGVQRTVRKCARGMVLGIDDLCYPKAVLPGRSKFRKWRRAPQAPVTRRDVVAIRRAGAARDRVLDLARDVGLSVSKAKTRKKKASGAHKH